MLLFYVRLLLAFTRIGSRTLSLCACEYFVCTAISRRAHTRSVAAGLFYARADVLTLPARVSVHLCLCVRVCVHVVHMKLYSIHWATEYLKIFSRRTKIFSRSMHGVCWCARVCAQLLGVLVCERVFFMCRFSFANYCSCVLSMSVYFVLLWEIYT